MWKLINKRAKNDFNYLQVDASQIISNTIKSVFILFVGVAPLVVIVSSIVILVFIVRSFIVTGLVTHNAVLMPILKAFYTSYVLIII